MIILLVAVATLAALAYWWTANTEFRKKVNLARQRFPGPREFPVIGSGYVFVCPTREILDVLDRLWNEFGHRFRLRIFHLDIFFITEPDDVEKVAASTVHVHKGDMYFALEAWLKGGLVTVKDANKHSRDRKLITPGFHFSILNNFLSTINTHCRILINVLRRDFRDGQSCDIAPYIGRFALDALCATAMGTEPTMDRDEESPYLKAIERLLDLISYRTFRPWLRPAIIWRNTKEGKEQIELIKIMRKFTMDVVGERREARKLARLDSEGKTKREEAERDDNVYFRKNRRLALLDTLLDVQDNELKIMTDEDIAQHIDTFMLAGHDTTKVTICWALLLIATSPSVQEKLHGELDTIFQSDLEREIMPDDVAQMKYLEQVIKETLRLYPPVSFLLRKLQEELTLADGTVIPPGCEVSFPLHLIHRDSKFFPDPQEFDPERFTPENSVKRHPYSYFPFAAGPRNCIGQRFAMMEMKVALAYIVRAFTIESTRTRKEVNRDFCLLTTPGNGILVRLFPRNGDKC